MNSDSATAASRTRVVGLVLGLGQNDLVVLESRVLDLVLLVDIVDLDLVVPS